MSVIDDVKARLDIVDVVSGYVTLHKAGRNYKALCPFHQERTPSFIVFPDTQTWRCFGACGEGGDVFGFVMKAQGWDFSETLRELAKRAGVELEPMTPAQVEEQAETDRLRALLHATAAFFHEQLLQSPAAQQARDYVQKRSLSRETVDAFMIGYAPADWRQALQHLQMHGYTQDEIIEAGVAIRSDKGSVYDRFRNRLVIPIRDGRGTTIGFGARALNKDDNPKYLNSPQGPLFDKSHILFGLDMARRAIRETETVIVVEGYMDAMQAHQGGYHNVVAQMGTALTEAQLQQLARYAKRLILALDPDVAGINATMRGLNVAHETLDEDQRVTFDPRGMMRYTGSLEIDIRVVTLPEGQDPDDLIRDNPGAWEALIEQAVPVTNYVINQAALRLPQNASVQDREAVAKELLPILISTEESRLSFISQQNIQALARRLRLDDYSLMQWAHALTAKSRRAVPSIPEQRKLAGRSIDRLKISGQPGQSVLREGFCLRLLLQRPDWLFMANRKLRELRGQDKLVGVALGPLNADDFSRSDYQAVFRAIDQAIMQDDLDPLDYLLENLPRELLAVVEELQVAPLDLFQQGLPRSLRFELESILRDQARTNTAPELDMNLFIGEILTLRYSRLERESRELYFIQQEADESGDENHHTAIEANRRAINLIHLTLDRMKNFARDR